MTYEQVFNMIQDELKLLSDDSDFNIEHIEFLCSKYRAYLIKIDNLNKKLLSEIGYDSPVYQQICLDLTEVSQSSAGYYPCDGGTVLKSKSKIPALLDENYKLNTVNFFQSSHIIVLHPAERFKYQGCNKWTKNLIYASILPDGYLYLKSGNPNYKELEKVRFTGVFSDIDSARDLLCDNDGNLCNYLTTEYPLEDYQLAALVQYVVQELTGSVYRPKDSVNNATDDLAKVGQIPSNKQNNEGQ